MASEGVANVRARAARLLADVVGRGRSLDRVLAAVPGTERDRALLAELVTGSVRHWFSLSARCEAHLHRPLRPSDLELRCLLVIGAYQLLHTRIPAYAAVSETVDAAATLRRTSAKGLVNSVLRAIDREPASHLDSEPARYDHPEWLVARIRQQHPDDWQHILAVNNQRAPMSLRVNARRATRDDYANRLAGAGIASRPGLAPYCLVLEQPRPAASLPGWEAGLCAVQDEGAQLVVDVLRPQTGERVLDACAAPGGKAAACLERTDIALVALDVDASRCETARRELARLGFDPTSVHHGDATVLDWWDGAPFDRVLIDAPCSGTGTLRRHPDIKLLRRESDLASYRAIQSRLLTVLWQTLRPGGSLVYCTCSILDDENDHVVAEFLSRHDDAHPASIVAEWGMATRYGRLLLPSENGPDGFYFASITRAERSV